MNYLKFALILSTLCVLRLSRVEAARPARDVETPTAKQEETTGKFDQQLMAVFDNFKKSVDEIAARINTEEIVQGIQNFTQKLENYAKETADKFASSASGTSTDTEPKKE